MQEFARLKERLEVLRDPVLMRQIAESRAFYAAGGRGETLDDVFGDAVPTSTFSPGTLAGAVQNLLDAGDPNSILAAATLTYSGPLGPQFLESFAANVDVNVSVVPLPATAWLLGSSLLGLATRSRRRPAIRA